MIEVKNTLKGELNASIIKEYPELENIIITPTQEEQKLKSEKYGFGDVTVKAIDSDEIVIIPSKEEQVKEGLFNKVSVGAIKTEEITVTPSKEEQIEEGLFDKVTVKAIETQDLVVTPTEEEQKFNGLFENVIVEASSGVDTSDATATADDIAKDKTAYVNGEKITGVFKGVDTSDATATASDLLTGKTAYVNGEKITGILETGGSSTGGLNSNFQKVNYLQGTGTQYIDTGVCPSSTGTYAALVDFMITKLAIVDNVPKEQWAFGQYLNGGWRCGGKPSSAIRFTFNYQGGFTYTSDDYNDRIIGMSVSNTITSEYPMLLFAQQQTGNAAYVEYGYFKIYGCKIWENGKLIRDFVPCYRKTDNEPGMYDIVNDVFYTNSGTGTFAIG